VVVGPPSPWAVAPRTCRATHLLIVVRTLGPRVPSLSLGISSCMMGKRQYGRPPCSKGEADLEPGSCGWFRGVFSKYCEESKPPRSMCSSGFTPGGRAARGGIISRSVRRLCTRGGPRQRGSVRKKPGYGIIIPAGSRLVVRFAGRSSSRARHRCSDRIGWGRRASPSVGIGFLGRLCQEQKRKRWAGASGRA